MKVLIVSSGNSGQISPFIAEQVESVKKYGVEFDTFSIVGKGLLGYMGNIGPLTRRIRSFCPDIIHAHYGLSGFLSFLVKGNHKLITTFHGNDINTLHPFNYLKPNINKLISRLVYSFSNHSIFVTEDLAVQLNAISSKSDIIPCQVNLDMFNPIAMNVARREMHLSLTREYVLFSSSFSTYIKNIHLAEQACKLTGSIDLIELKGYSRREVSLLLNACNVALVTSFNEGSNQFIKEAMACNRPVVSTMVGDSKHVFGDTEGCYLTSFDPMDVAQKLRMALDFGTVTGQTKGRERIIHLGLDADSIAMKVYNVYIKVSGIKE
jgi:teichuronic acid biosynthesis glycosyltransferase TuaC